MSIYTALSGAVAAEERVNAVANNLANINTDGFKKDRLTFREYLTELEKEDESGVLPRATYTWDDYNRLRGHDKSFVDVDTTEIDFSQGNMRPTSKPLDVAINGEGFFVVKTPLGLGYTRNGNFNINSEGKLVTSEGYLVLNGEGPFENSADAEGITITGSKLDIDAEGSIFQDGKKTEKIAYVSFEDLRGLRKVGSSIFINKDPVVNPQKPSEAELVQGSLEGSNVNVIQEMVEMIAANRAFESYRNVIKNFNEINTKSVNEIGRLVG